jgi:hypothetical protein
MTRYLISVFVLGMWSAGWAADDAPKLPQR